MIELSQKDADELRSIQKRLSKYRAARAERLSKLRWGPIHCAETLLEIGERDGYRYMILHNGMGYRTGYIRVPHNHPWAKNYAARENARMNVRCHGGITFVGRDEQPHGGRPR